MDATHLPPDALGLGASLLIGLLIGLQRGWQERDLPEGGRVAGLRTFALVGLLGGVLGSWLPRFGPWPLVAALLGVALLLAVSYGQAARHSHKVSVTSAVAMLLTLLLGAYAAAGGVALAFAAAVVVSVLLDLKPTLHGWLRAIDHRELSAALQLLVLTVVILPNLPNQGYGPYDAWNPHELWWAVVLITGLSLSGHWAIRMTGTHRGLLWTGWLGGLASSTAATLALARYARAQPALAPAAAAGTLAAWGVMFLRMAGLIAAIQPGLLATLGATLLAPALALLAFSAALAWRTPAPAADDPAAPQAPPLGPTSGLGTALGFGAFLALMAVLVPAAREALGAQGVLVLSAVSGLADVDAIVISLARQPDSGGAAAATTALAIGLAALSNTLVKAGIAWSTGGGALGRPVLLGATLAGLAGALGTAAALALG